MLGVWLQQPAPIQQPVRGVLAASPQSVGFDLERLALVDGVIEDAIKSEDIPRSCSCRCPP